MTYEVRTCTTCNHMKFEQLLYQNDLTKKYII